MPEPTYRGAVMTFDELTAAYHEIPCKECGAAAKERCHSPKGNTRSVPHNARVTHGTKRMKREATDA